MLKSQERSVCGHIKGEIVDIRTILLTYFMFDLKFYSYYLRKNYVLTENICTGRHVSSLILSLEFHETRVNKDLSHY